MAQYNLPSLTNQSNYTYGNMNQWGTPSGRVPVFNTSAENPMSIGLSPDDPYLGGMDDLNRNLGQTFTGFGNSNTPFAPGYSMPEIVQSNVVPGSELPGGGEPEKEGAWIKPAQFGLGAARVGTGIYNAMQSAKMNKFMRGYYGDMRDLQQADFANSARSTNTALEGQTARQYDAQGIPVGSAENTARVADFMKRHGVSETA